MITILKDWLIELRFNVPLDIKWIISETLFPANLLVSTEKIEEESWKKKHNHTISLG